MNVLRTSAFRNIRRITFLISFLMLILPAVFLASRFHLETLYRILLPVSAVVTTLRLLMMVSLSNHLAEAASASVHFYHAKNWLLMQSVTDAAALLMNVAVTATKTMFEQAQEMRHILMITGFLVYLLVIQGFDTLAKVRLLRGFDEVWYLCGGESAQSRAFRLTQILQYLGCMLLLPFAVMIGLHRLSAAYLTAGAAFLLLLTVQFRISVHAKDLAQLLADISE